MLPWNNDTAIEKMDGCNWCCQITSFFQYIYALNQGGTIISNYDTSLLQFLFCKNTIKLREFLAAFALLLCYSSNGWLQLELRINAISLKKWMTAKCLFQRNTVSLKILGHCKTPPEIIMVPLKYIAASAPLKKQYVINRDIFQIHSI